MPYSRPADQAACNRAWYARNRDAAKRRARAFTREAIARNQAFVNQVKRVPCADCGHSYPPVVMDLDHVRGKKDRNVANMVQDAVSLDKLAREVAKCDVVCSNCHRLRTATRRLLSTPEAPASDDLSLWDGIVGGASPSPATTSAA